MIMDDVRVDDQADGRCRKVHTSLLDNKCTEDESCTE